jgi:hypothetical protein
VNPAEPRIPITPAVIDGLGTSDIDFSQAGFDDRLRSQMMPLKAAARAVRALDPITLDLVRLRNAELQGCNF